MLEPAVLKSSNSVDVGGTIQSRDINRLQKPIFTYRGAAEVALALILY